MEHDKSSLASPAPCKTSVFIVDDHPTVRRGMNALFSLETDLMICGEAEGASDAWMKISGLRPAVVVVDLTLREGDGLELIQRLRRVAPDLTILAFTMHSEPAYLARALKAGADDVVLKDQGAEKVITTIRALLRGRAAATKESNRIGVTDSSAEGLERLAALNHRLSHREIEVFYLMGQGLNTGQIARRLRISPSVVDSHRKNIQRELGLRNAPTLSRYARRLARFGDAA